jgi:hypothetical protein
VTALTPRFRETGLDWLKLAVAVLAILVLTWPINTAQRVTTDSGWQIGLHQAIADGLPFGQDIVFTYGPLGFLGQPIPFLGATSALAFVASALIYAALIAVLLVSTRRVMPLWGAVIVTLLIAVGFEWLGPFEALEALTFALGVIVLRGDRILNEDAVAIVAAILSSFAALTKLNVGVFVVAMAVVVVLAVSRPRWRGLLVMIAAGAVSTFVLWVVTRQQLADLVGYVRGSIEIVAGYSEAMVSGSPAAPFYFGLFAIVGGLLVWMAWRTSLDWPRDRRFALAGLVTVLLFAAWKYSVVRDNFPPATLILVIATVCLLPTTLHPRNVVIVLIALAIAFAGITWPSAPSVARLTDVPRSVSDFAHQARTTASPWRWDAAAKRSRAGLRSIYRVQSQALTAIGDRSVHVDPYAAAVVTAYGLAWRPEPIFQSYSAYTPYLDGLNADLLRSDARPEHILRQFLPVRVDGGRPIPYSIDGRFYWFESPAATLERLCRYQEVTADERWQVLAASGHACGPAVPLATTTAALGAAVAVPDPPSPRDIVVVRIEGLDQGLLGRIRTAIWRAPIWTVALDGYRYRLVAATAPDGLVLAVPSADQGSPPFAYGPPVRTIAVEPSDLGGDGQVTYTFEAVPLE